VCGSTFADLVGTTPLKRLVCGNLSLGGGASQVPDNQTPSGATNRFSIACTGPNCTVGPVNTATPDYDCTTTGCAFGTPLEISNAGLSVCVTNTFSAPVAGTLNKSDGSAVFTTFQLSSRTILTATPTQPCPRCYVNGGVPTAGDACSPAKPCTGLCDGGPNGGLACTTKNPKGLTGECPAPDAVTGTSKCYRGAKNGQTCAAAADCGSGATCALFIGDIPIALNPLTTGTTSKTSAAGTFCSGQTSSQKGAFKSDVCQAGANSGMPCFNNADCPGSSCRSGTFNNYCSAGTNAGKGCSLATDCGTGGVCVKAGTLAQRIEATGVPGGALSVNVPAATKLASVFCVPVTTNGTVNANANLPGPGATTLIGTVTLLP
jgi:hypothetical protein